MPRIALSSVIAKPASGTIFILRFATRGPTPGTRSEWLTAVSPHWQIPTTSIPLSSKSKNKELDASNLAGEDFLFVHHSLIVDMRDILAEAGQPCISSWPNLPDPRDTATPDEGALAKDYPVPGAGSNPLKGDIGIAAMKNWEKKLKNRNYLKTIALRELGEILEAQIFRPSMLRFTALEAKSGIRPRILAKDDIQNPNWAWNQPDYDLLSDNVFRTREPYFLEASRRARQLSFSLVEGQWLQRDCGGLRRSQGLLSMESYLGGSQA